MAVWLASLRDVRVLCVREVQNSIKESVHRLLCDRIEQLEFYNEFDIQENGIFGKRTRSEFIFTGIRNDPRKVKSTEGIDICLVEEAETVTKTSWRILLPTIFRRPQAETWVVFNPNEETDATYQRFIANPSTDARVVEVNWHDNPWFPAGLEAERQDAVNLINRATDDEERAQAQAEYDHVWEGKTQRHHMAAIFRRRVVVEQFEPLESTRFYFGADWGFANDPTALVRFWITTNADRSEELWIDYESVGYRVEIDETPQLFLKIPGAEKWPIKADSARPETISYMARTFNVKAAEKWPGSVEDGIAHMKGFVKIHIHPRCKVTIEEARLYSYKVDKITGDVLPIVVDKHNHCMDAIRYGLDGVIQRRGGLSQWERLGKRN